MAIINIKVQDRQTLLDVAIQYLGDAAGAIDLAQLNNISITDSPQTGQILKVDTDQVIDARVVSYLREKDVVPITDLEVVTYASPVSGSPNNSIGFNGNVTPVVNPSTSGENTSSNRQSLVPKTMEVEFKEVAITTVDFNGWVKYRKIGAQVELHLHITYTSDHEMDNYLLHQIEVGYRPKESILVPAIETYPSGVQVTADIVNIDHVSGKISALRSRGLHHNLQIHCFYAYV